MTQSRFAIVALVTEVSRGLTGPTPVVRAGFMAFTIISSSSHSRIGTGDLNRIPKRKTLERQPATASLISSEGTKVYTGCIRGQVGLAGRCLIDYEQRIRRVSVFLRKCNSRPSSAAASGMTSGRSENAEHFQPTASPLTFPFSGQSCAATLAKNALRFTDSLSFAKTAAQYFKFALVDSATCGPSRGGVFGTQDVRSYFVGNKPLIEDLPQQFTASRILHPGCTRFRTRLRTDVRFRRR